MLNLLIVNVLVILFWFGITFEIMRGGIWLANQASDITVFASVLIYVVWVYVSAKLFMWRLN